jgi:hypothetical protein
MQLRLVLLLVLLIFASQTLAQNSSKYPAPQPQRDGEHDFDFEIGLWKTKLRRLVRPLTGSTTWVEYEGTSKVSKVLDGARQFGRTQGRWSNGSYRRS